MVAKNGAIVDERQMRIRLVKTVKAICRVLLDNASTRNALQASLRVSPFTEHKIHLADFLRSTAGAGLRDEAARSTGSTSSNWLAGLDSLRDLELYFPRSSDLTDWSGGTNLLIATSLRVGDSTLVFDLEGRIVDTNARFSPAAPTLALVNAETDFSAPAEVPSSINDGSGGGGAPPPLAPGLYLRSLSLTDLHEGFPRGNPEIEVCLIGRTASSGGGVAQAGICANEGGCQSTVICDRVFDMNTNSWYPPGGTSVMVASRAELDAIAALYPGAAKDTVPFMLEVWEDDTNRGVIYDDHNQIGNFLVDAGLAGVGLGIVRARIQTCEAARQAWTHCDSNVLTGFLTLAGAVLSVLGTYYGLHKLVNWITGANDDLVGGIADTREAVLHLSGASSTTSHVVLLNHAKVGEASLFYVP